MLADRNGVGVTWSFAGDDEAEIYALRSDAGFAVPLRARWNVPAAARFPSTAGVPVGQTMSLLIRPDRPDTDEDEFEVVLAAGPRDAPVAITSCCNGSSCPNQCGMAIRVGDLVHVIVSAFSSRADVVETRSLHEQVDGAVVSLPECAPLVVANPSGARTKRWRPEMMLATALGHVVMDSSDDAPYAELDTAWSYWPAAARARAFAAMFLMPEEGVQEIIEAAGKIDAGTVEAIMRRFGTGPTATTWHLMNLRHISEDERDALLGELAA